MDNLTPEDIREAIEIGYRNEPVKNCQTCRYGAWSDTCNKYICEYKNGVSYCCKPDWDKWQPRDTAEPMTSGYVDTEPDKTKPQKIKVIQKNCKHKIRKGRCVYCGIREEKSCRTCNTIHGAAICADCDAEYSKWQPKEQTNQPCETCFSRSYEPYSGLYDCGEGVEGIVDVMTGKGVGCDKHMLDDMFKEQSGLVSPEHVKEVDTSGAVEKGCDNCGRIKPCRLVCSGSGMWSMWLPKPKQTNHDRLRKMKKGELARWFSETFDDCITDNCPAGTEWCIDEMGYKHTKLCRKAWKQYLKQPAERMKFRFHAGK